mgnify:CR=1 FL=1
MKLLSKTMTESIALVRNYGFNPGLLILGVLIGVLTPAFAFANDDHERGDRGARDRVPQVEVQITGNGSALVRGAVVTGISSTTISANTLHGSTTAAWAVKISGTTAFVNHSGRGTSSTDIAVGDIISFQGSIETGSLFTVHARVVKHWSSAETWVKKSFSGPVITIATSTQTFTMNGGSEGAVTVRLASSSVLTLDGGVALLFANLLVGDMVKASGAYDGTVKTLTANKVVVKRDDDDSSFHGVFKIWKDKFKLDFKSKSKHEDDD